MGGCEEGPKFSITFTKRAKRRLDRLLKKSDKSLELSFLKAVDSLAQDPESGKHLKGRLKGQLSVRFGEKDNYRIIYEVDEAKREVIVTDVGHRKSVYDR